MNAYQKAMALLEGPPRLPSMVAGDEPRLIQTPRQHIGPPRGMVAAPDLTKGCNAPTVKTKGRYFTETNGFWYYGTNSKRVGAKSPEEAVAKFQRCYRV